MNGVLDMAFLSIIRRWHKRDHVPIREISQRWLAKFGQVDKWNFCLRAAQNAADQERQ